MVRLTALLAATAVLGSTFVVSHPGEDENAVHLAKRAEYIAETARSVAECVNSPEYAAVREAAVKRRSMFLAHLRREAEARDLAKRRRRDLTTALNTDHNNTRAGLTSSTDNSTLFGSSPKCLLAPETTAGPYFVAGEPIRNNIVDSQSGLPLYVDIQIVDKTTCKVVPNLYINFWHCNSTGVYSGVVAGGNGNSADTSNSLKNFNRGLYPTDATGVVQFTTTFPGHYTSRTTHIHVATASGGTVLSNNTYANATYSHVGQLFFDQALITAVEKLSPYTTNTQTLTTNAADSVLKTAAASTFDPFLNYTYINSDLSNGILAWISIAIDTSAVVPVTPAAYYTGTGSSTPSPTASASKATGTATPTSSVGSSPSSSASKTPSTAQSPSNTPSPSVSPSSKSNPGAPPSDPNASPTPSTSKSASTSSDNSTATASPSSQKSSAYRVMSPVLGGVTSILLSWILL